MNTIIQEIRDRSKNPHVLLVTRLSLETGARWAEAERLTLSRLKPYRVTYDQTKSGKKRSGPISKALYQALKQHLEEWGGFGTSTISAFRRAVDRTGIKLPEGQCAHILRHTFASHFMMNGGNILALQKILGHSTINMPIRYAHLAPDHLEEAILLNPMNGVDVSLTLEEKTEGQKRKKPLKSGA
ncbi:MAG: tyrosine-type recombinase/integrase [Pseudomonadota bacterium]